MRRQFSGILLCFFVVLPQIAFAQKSDSPQNYFQAVGSVVGQIRYIKWMEELCSEQFPDTKSKNSAAYSDWRAHYHAFVDEMEGQFEIVEKHWRNLYPQQSGIDMISKKLSDGVNAQRVILKQQNSARGEKAVRWMCDLYPERIATRTNDLESRLSIQVSIIRRGPEQ
jgi:hypothetical protein